MLRAHYRDAIATSRLAIEAATEAGARAEEGHARNTLGASLATQGRLDEGIAELEAARHIAVELGRPDDECRALSNIASRLAQGSQLTEALNWARTGIDVSRRHGMVGFYGAYIAATAALCLIRLGRLDEADAISAEMLSGRLSTVSAVELRLGRITMLIRRGDLAEARALLDETAAMVAEVESVNFWGQLWIARAELAMAEDRSDAVLAAVKEGLALVATTDEESCGPELCWLAARVAADAGDAAAASEWLAELERFLDRPRTRGVEPLPDAKGFCLLALAEVARAADDPAAADRWEAGAGQWGSAGQRHQSAYAQSRF